MPSVALVACGAALSCKSDPRSSFLGLDPPDQGAERRIGAQFVAQRRSGIFKRLAVDAVNDRDAGLHRLLTRLPLIGLPLAAHITGRFAGGRAEDSPVLCRQFVPGAA